MKPTTDFGSWQKLQSPLPHENRLQMILRHMKEANQTPTVDDFNYIIKQMSAVGHVRGASDVLHELDSIPGLEPNNITFRHVLQTCVFLIESPFPTEVRNLAVKASTEVALDIVDRMQAMNMDIEEAIVELLLRIFKENRNIEACEQILRTVCAFDIRRPDRMPEEFEARLKEADRLQKPLPVPLKLTTSMFTTLVSLYGSAGEIPRMITLFEVLTNPYPLPSNLPSPSSDWWDDDIDEYDVATPVVQTPLKHRPEYIWEPQRASPNSATFAMLIRNLAWAGQRMLCEHYMLLAEEFDKQEADRLREQISREIERHRSVSTQMSGNQDRQVELVPSPDFIPSPRFLITPLMFMPAFAYANRQRILELMRWMRYHLRGVIWRRQSELSFFKKSYEELPSGTFPSRAVARLSSSHHPCMLLCMFSNVLLTASLDLDYSGMVEGTDNPKPLDLGLHIKLVESSLTSFGAMLERADEVIARLKQRSLERITRRVWNNQDIYLRDVDDRVLLSKEEWENRVQWKVWAGPVTGAQLNRGNTLSAKTANQPPARWMDERLRARIESKQDTPD